MNDTHNKSLVSNAQVLRKKMTKEEKHLWYDFLKKLPINVNRQKVILNYIVDFYIPCARLVIELDGSQHYEESAQKADEKRDEALRELGILVLRYTNHQIQKSFKDVCMDIKSKIEERQKNVSI
ncbi:MAG: DUF559 domain-containing protein [Clostridia bacterium]|nr:DUF559 domain-containing protein [Clostridia bacterium]